MPRFMRFRKMDSLLAAAIGFAIIILFTKHSGIGISPDSVVYLATAENLHTTGKLVDFTHEPIVDFPSGYPIFINMLIWLTHMKPLTFAPILNALLFGLAIYLAGFIMERLKHSSNWCKWAVLSCLAISPCLLEVYSMLWSETVFIVLLLLFFMAMHRYFKSYSLKFIIAAAIIASLAAVTRYAGITIIGTGGLLLLLDMKREWRQKVQPVLLYAFIAPLPLAVNLIRNHIVGGTLTGMRERSLTSLGKNLEHVGTVFYDWLTGTNSSSKGAIWLGTLVMVTSLIACTRLFLHKRRLADLGSIMALFALVYLLFMVFMATVSRFETLNSRFLAPVFIPLVCTYSHWLVSLHYHMDFSKRKWSAALCTIVFLLFQYGQVVADAETWDGVKDAGIPGYAEDSWKLSETVQFIQKDSLPFKKGYTIYANAYDAVYFFTGRSGKFTPHKEDPKAIKELLNDPHCYFISFDDGDNTDLLDLDFMTRTKKMKLLKKLGDGAIYVFE